jgi:SAM-dependent methyltransferase
LTFGREYSNLYDWIYADKDYAGECDRLELLIRRFAPTPVRSVLDLGCGTGGHAFALAERGYQVVGVDRSEDMIARAREKLAERRSGAGTPAPDFQQGDLQSLDLVRQFDVALMMFAVLGYQASDDQVVAALATARRHLSPGGLLAFDVWYGPAVLSQRPAERVKVLDTPHGAWQREATPELDLSRHLCVVHYRLRRVQAESPAGDIAEDHSVRYFFPMELEQFLAAVGLELVHLSDFADLEVEPSVDTWNVVGCARAV